MKILLTGGAGDLGRDLGPLLARYHDVKVLDIKKPDNDLEFVSCDISKSEDVEQATKGVDVITHLAALISADTSTQFIDVNTKGTCNILEAALKNGVKKVVYASSVWAASRGLSVPYLPIDENIPCQPEGMYDITKRMGEEFCEYFYRMYGLNTMILRLCGYYPVEGFSSEGDILWDKIDLPEFAGRFVGTGPAFKLTNAWDLTQAFKAAIEDEKIQHDVFIIGLGAPFMREDAEGLKNMPLAVLEKYYPGASEFFKEIGVDVPEIRFWYNTEKAKKHLGFSPKFALQDVMKQYYENKEK
ncbi:NAD(P)-dependent oxidoreductase [bacterium]|nr:NAD(P)-dependent oxidoreductase [bacterium]